MQSHEPAEQTWDNSLIPDLWLLVFAHDGVHRGFAPLTKDRTLVMVIATQRCVLPGHRAQHLKTIRVAQFLAAFSPEFFPHFRERQTSFVLIERQFRFR